MAAISTLNPIDIYNYRTPQNQGDITARRQAGTPQAQNTPSSGRSVSMAVEAYKSESMYIEYTSKDGDKAILSYQNVEYQKAQIQVNPGSTTSDQDWQKIVDNIMEEFRSMKSEIIQRFLNGINGGDDHDAGNVSAQPSEVKAAVVPEYWNAENTSQRIVDFALQFYDAFEGAGEEFLAKIRDAIKQGFEMAGKEMGDLPDSVNKLVQDTFDLTMKKLDDWAESKGIAVGDLQTAGAQNAVEQAARDTIGAAV